MAYLHWSKKSISSKRSFSKSRVTSNPPQSPSITLILPKLFCTSMIYFICLIALGLTSLISFFSLLSEYARTYFFSLLTYSEIESSFIVNSIGFCIDYYIACSYDFTLGISFPSKWFYSLSFLIHRGYAATDQRYGEKTKYHSAQQTISINKFWNNSL